ncbi:MAG: PspC domain-containing protein [bacterium]|nr:PspC domain-containing protein [bacterium]
MSGGKIKKLVRKKDGRVLGGVCAGLADYLGIDVIIVRLILIALTLAWGGGLLFYLLAWIIIPEEE